MSTDQIPADIWQRAHDIMDDACLPEILVTNGTDRAIRDAIALALLSERQKATEAERDRCKAIAFERRDICADACEKIEAGELYRDTPHALVTENTARLEADYIGRLIAGDPYAVPLPSQAPLIKSRQPVSSQANRDAGSDEHLPVATGPNSEDLPTGGYPKRETVGV